MKKSFDNSKGKIKKMFDNSITDENTIVVKKDNLDNANNIKINLENSFSFSKIAHVYGGEWTILTYDSSNTLLYATWSITINNIKPSFIPFIRRQINIKSPDDTFKSAFPSISHKTILLSEDKNTGLYFIRLDSSIAFLSSSTSQVEAKLNVRIINPERMG